MGLLPLGPTSSQRDFVSLQLTTLPWRVSSMLFSVSTAKDCLHRWRPTWAGNEACFVTQLPDFRITCLWDAAEIPLRSKLERTSIRTELETAIPGLKESEWWCSSKPWKLYSIRLRCRIWISNYVRYNRDSRKREIPPFTMALQFEFERKRLYVITHDLLVTPTTLPSELFEFHTHPLRNLPSSYAATTPCPVQIRYRSLLLRHEDLQSPRRLRSALGRIGITARRRSSSGQSPLDRLLPTYVVYT